MPIIELGLQLPLLTPIPSRCTCGLQQREAQRGVFCPIAPFLGPGRAVQWRYLTTRGRRHADTQIWGLGDGGEKTPLTPAEIICIEASPGAQGYPRLERRPGGRCLLLPPFPPCRLSERIRLGGRPGTERIKFLCPSLPPTPSTTTKIRPEIPSFPVDSCGGTPITGIRGSKC